MPTATHPFRAESAAHVPERGGPRPNCVADDWGMSPGINEGILELCEAGVVRGVSLFGNLEHLDHGLERLLRAGGLSFSVHLNFTYGRPLSRPGEVPSLCRPDGVFRSLPALCYRAVSGRLSAEELRTEARRQIRRLKSLGVPLTGIEGHHHAHLLPHVFSALAPLLREEGIGWVRLPADRGHVPSWLAGNFFRRRFLSAGRGGDFELRPTLYLRPADLRAAGALRKKIFSGGGLPVITHPALYYDLRRMEHADTYREQRVLEFRGLFGLSRPDGGLS